ncbi:amino acid ABC transporter [Falsochrobactrum shanghaiense]|uniref:Amino acid ABC transporter n=1 Tax=Falsochrobactrum shanghaiense TaxID=2201899 RepID=A0A316JF51_9HYPH|nr:transporter substrate-binding domain-containing protein [Falsochrobactrum shanghaiense]PWL19225.1 amino acid ABC transporter [Falsochrobactrum shanghaiense]
MRRHFLNVAIAFCWLLGSLSLHARAEPKAPDFFNQMERLPLPSLQGLNRLRFVTTLDFPPFNMLNDAGQLSGYNVDLAKALCSQMGLNDICQIEAVAWDDLESHLEKGEAEAIIAGLGPNEQNRQTLAFTRPYMRLPARFVTLKTNMFNGTAARALAGKNVGVIAGTAHEQLLKNYFPQAEAKPFPQRQAMLGALQKGDVEAIFDDGMTLSFWLDHGQSGDCCSFSDGPYPAPQYLGPGLSIAVGEQNAPLAAAFNNALQALQEKGTLAELYLRYFPISFY